jgi:hypothetical protein
MVKKYRLRLKQLPENANYSFDDSFVHYWDNDGENEYDPIVFNDYENYLNQFLAIDNETGLPYQDPKTKQNITSYE